MGLAPTPVVPLDPLLQQFLRLVEVFEANPTPAGLRELERLATHLMARARQLGPAALALLQGAVARVLAVLVSPTVVIWAGAIAGAALLWWGFFTVLSEQIKFPDPSVAADAAIAAIQAQLFGWGVEFWNGAARRCWEAFKESLIDLINRAGSMKSVLGSPEWLPKYKLLIGALLKCVLGDLGSLTVGMRDKLADLLQKMLVASGLLAGGLLAGAGAADAAEPHDQDVADAVKTLGLTGIPRGDGFGYCESRPLDEAEGADSHEDGEVLAEEAPCDPMPWDVELRVDLPLSGFPDVDLDKRKAILACWMKYYEDLIVQDRGALRKRDDDTDTRREDLLRLRLQVNRRELERLRRAKQNTDRECQLRELRRSPTVLAPPMESRLRLRFPDLSNPF
ncbi:hypothetical protein SAMN04488523_10240 [Sulfitobacter brevis]|uniref:Uncharacterized protein n=2 Tax=Sulfitobacter brevis TaxID=74348 RepID=A0A1I1UIG7_9RHOB|nr:hypothetical protein SAMN04488523_10240 [Sulfitobacter brevis]